MRRLDATATGAAAALGLAAGPALALMALLTAGGGGPLDAICSAATPWGGMATMYLLMSAFHLPPWLRLLGRSLPAGGPAAARAADPGRIGRSHRAPRPRGMISDC